MVKKRRLPSPEELSARVRAMSGDWIEAPGMRSAPDDAFKRIGAEIASLEVELGEMVEAAEDAAGKPLTQAARWAIYVIAGTLKQTRLSCQEARDLINDSLSDPDRTVANLRAAALERAEAEARENFPSSEF